MPFSTSAIPIFPAPPGCREAPIGGPELPDRRGEEPTRMPTTRTGCLILVVLSRSGSTEVDRVKRHLSIIGASPRLASLALLGVGALALADSGSAAPASPSLLPVQTSTPAPEARLSPLPAPETASPGAADLLDDVPLRIGLSDDGFPAPQVLPEPTPAPVSPPAPAGVQAVPPPPRQLVLDRRRKVLKVLDGKRELRRYPVAVGMPGWETPVGQFTVIEKTANPKWEHPASGHVLPPGPENPLGSRWIGFYRDCRGRSGFNGQEHLVVKGCVTAGFHGTPNRSSVGRAVSHGCVRLFDEHAKELFDLVSLGTPVTVLP
jgi:L,D-transpeptidase ErfK/SrfK